MEGDSGEGSEGPREIGAEAGVECECVGKLVVFALEALVEVKGGGEVLSTMLVTSGAGVCTTDCGNRVPTSWVQPA